MKIERVVSPAGIEAWLVREQTVPLVSLSFVFHGGSSQDEADKSGAANLSAELARRGRRRPRRQGFPREAGRQRDRVRFPRQPRLLLRHAAHAQRTPRRGLRSAASCVDGAALRCRGCRARARPDFVVAAPRPPPAPTTFANRSWWEAAFPATLTAAKAGHARRHVPRITAADLRDYVAPRLRAQRA